MKKKLKIFALMLSILTLAIGQTAFAAEPALASNETVEVANEIQPRGTLSGYGSHWYNSGEDANGSFTFKVTGAPWVNAHLTVSMDNFNSETAVRITVMHPVVFFQLITLLILQNYI